jgi:hypothetical protein
MKKLLTLFIMSVLCTQVFSSEANVELKAGGAVTAFVKEDGFKLSSKALVNLGINFTSLVGANKWELPKSALVRIKKSIGVYRRYDGWITMVLVSIVEKKKSTVVVKSVDLESGDEVAISGVKFLRMTDSDLNSETVDACSH